MTESRFPPSIDQEPIDGEYVETSNGINGKKLHLVDEFSVPVMPEEEGALFSQFTAELRLLTDRVRDAVLDKKKIINRADLKLLITAVQKMNGKIGKMLVLRKSVPEEVRLGVDVFQKLQSVVTDTRQKVSFAAMNLVGRIASLGIRSKKSDSKNLGIHTLADDIYDAGRTPDDEDDE